MINEVAVCFRIANDAHSTQFRWDGTPYMSHINAVYGNLIKAVIEDKIMHLSDRDFIMAQCAALLHDVVEDCMTAEELRDLLRAAEVNDEFADELVSIVADELTHTKGLSYIEYVHLMKSKIAILVKYCDMQHNMNCSMQNIIDNHDIVRAAKQLQKYGTVIGYITKRIKNVETNS